MLNYFKAIVLSEKLRSFTFVRYWSSVTPPKAKDEKTPIQTLTELINSKQKLEIPKFDKSDYEPSELFLKITDFIKTNTYQFPEQAQKVVNIINNYKDKIDYVKYLASLLLPTDQMWEQLNVIYIEIATNYLKLQIKFNKQTQFYILHNIYRIIQDIKSEWMDQNWLDRDYSKQQYVLNLLVPKLIQNQKQFDIVFFTKVVQLCHTLQVDNPLLCQYLVKKINSNEVRVKMQDIIDILLYLSRAYIFPYEHFYKHKAKWIKTIQSYKKFSTKKSKQSIKMFQIMVMVNPKHCQILIYKLQSILYQAVPSFDHLQLANIWLIVNRAKFGIQWKFIQKLLEKMTQLVSSMQNRQLCLLVRGFSNFRYVQDFKNQCEYILNIISQNLNINRIYESQIVQIMLRKLKETKKEPLSVLIH